MMSTAEEGGSAPATPTKLYRQTVKISRTPMYTSTGPTQNSVACATASAITKCWALFSTLWQHKFRNGRKEIQVAHVAGDEVDWVGVEHRRCDRAMKAVVQRVNLRAAAIV
jgi:hypothetical protein